MLNKYERLILTLVWCLNKRINHLVQAKNKQFEESKTMCPTQKKILYNLVLSNETNGKLMHYTVYKVYFSFVILV